MPAHRFPPRLSTVASAALRSLAVCTAAAAPWLAALAAPLPPVGGSSLAVVTTDRICNGNANPNATLIGCAVTSGPSVSATGLMDAFGAQGAGSILATAHGADMRALARAVVTRGGQIGDSVGVTIAQFDMFTVQGPTATVPLLVTMDLDATVERAGPAAIVSGRLIGQVGLRAAASTDNFSALSDRLDLNQRMVRSFNYATGARGLLTPVIDDQSSGTFTVPVGRPFEFGFEATVLNLNLDTTASLRWAFGLPEGYTMTSARGLAVNLPAVPEPAQGMLMLGGLAVLGVCRRLRRRG